MDAIPARLFGPGSPPTGEEVSLLIREHHVEIRGGGGARTVVITALKLREVISAHGGLELSWGDPRGLCAVQVFDPAALEQLRAHTALRNLPQMKAVRIVEGRRRFGRRVGFTLLLLIAALPVLLLVALFWQADRIAGAIADRIPVQREQQFGRQVFQGMWGRLTLKDAGPDFDLVRMLGARLTRGSRFTYEFHVAEDSTVNAFALPGGVVVVHSGLIRATRTPEELAGVLAHEVQHVELRHSLKAMIKETGLRGLWAAATGDLGGTLAGQAALKLGSLRFSREAESQADARGFDTLVNQNIDPQGMVDFFGVMGGQAGVAPPAWLSTHPSSQSRQQALRALRQSLGERRFPPLNATP